MINIPDFLFGAPSLSLKEIYFCEFITRCASCTYSRRLRLDPLVHNKTNVKVSCLFLGFINTFLFIPRFCELFVLEINNRGGTIIRYSRVSI